MEKPIKMDDWGGTPIFGNIHVAARFPIPNKAYISFM